MALDRFRFQPDKLRRRWRDQLVDVRVENPDRECQDLPTERIRCRAESTTF